MASSAVVDKFLQAIENAAIDSCDAWGAGATLDVTVPNWRMHVLGPDAIRAEYGAGSPIPAGSRSCGGTRLATALPKWWSTPSAGRRMACHTRPTICTS